MPIRYTRVGWQDAPSTETPIDAANLNHMDNGILAISQELDTELDAIRDEFDALEQDTSSQIDSFKEETSAQISEFSSDITAMQNGLPGMISDKMDDKFGQEIGDNVTSWLTEHVDPAGSAVVVDDTLTIQGAAADAKKAGDEISSLKEDLSAVTGNTYNLVVGKLSARSVNGNGGIVNWGNTTDMVIAPVSEGVTYTIKTNDTSGFAGAFYSTVPTDNTTASYNNSRIVQANKTFTAPIDGYVAFRTLANYAYAQIVEGNVDLDYIEPETAIDRTARRDISLFPKNKLDGKILCCCGDSITYGADMDAEGIADTSEVKMYQANRYGIFTRVTSNFLKTWGYQIAERNNMTFYNGGVSGSTVQGILDRYGFSLSGGRYTRLPDAIDYLLLWFGWNDTAYGTLGTIGDTTNQSYYGGYNVVLPYLIDKYPYAKIALVVPFGTDEGHRNAIRQLGNKWGVAVWDNYQGGTPLYYGKEPSVGVEQSVVVANQAKFQANGAHPNYKGHKQLADMIEEFIRGI